jgi:hypothetical protein
LVVQLPHFWQVTETPQVETVWYCSVTVIGAAKVGLAGQGVMVVMAEERTPGAAAARKTRVLTRDMVY